MRCAYIYAHASVCTFNNINNIYINTKRRGIFIFPEGKNNENRYTHTFTGPLLYYYFGHFSPFPIFPGTTLPASGARTNAARTRPTVNDGRVAAAAAAEVTCPPSVPRALTTAHGPAGDDGTRWRQQQLAAVRRRPANCTVLPTVAGTTNATGGK